MEGQKDETDKCINVIFDIEELLGLEQGVLSCNISHTRCLYSPYAINNSQLVNYLKI